MGSTAGLSRRWTDTAFLILLSASALLLAFGLFLPAFTSDQLGADARSYSIVAGVLKLYRQGSPGLATVITLFSIVFPIAKLAAMAVIRLRNLGARREVLAVRALEMLGKWSMLDVFVVATLIGAARLKMISKIVPEPGIYCFAYSILASLVASYLLAETLATVRRPAYEAPSRGLRLTSLVLGLLSLIVFAVGVSQPLMQVEKWLFWDKEYSLFSALFEMWGQNEHLLPIVIALFVILLPILRYLALLAVRLIGSNSPPLLTRVAFSLEKWSMWDVYALALIVVIVKLGDLADVQPMVGFWLIVGAIALSAVDGWIFRLRLRFEPRPQG